MEGYDHVTGIGTPHFDIFLKSFLSMRTTSFIRSNLIKMGGDLIEKKTNSHYNAFYNNKYVYRIIF